VRYEECLCKTSPNVPIGTLAVPDVDGTGRVVGGTLRDDLAFGRLIVPETNSVFLSEHWSGMCLSFQPEQYFLAFRLEH